VGRFGRQAEATHAMFSNVTYRTRVLDQAPDSLIVDDEDGNLDYYDQDYRLAAGRTPNWYRQNME